MADDVGHRVNWVSMVFPDVLFFPSSISGRPLLSSAKTVLGTLFTASGLARCLGTKQGCDAPCRDCQPEAGNIRFGTAGEVRFWPPIAEAPWRGWTAAGLDSGGTAPALPGKSGAVWHQKHYSRRTA